MPKPICFMIMPYGRKATQVEPSSNAPGEIDFDALWDRAFEPVVSALGYEPVRADQDIGPLITNQMMERLYFADLVLAEMTIQNGNVYYEVGIRHAAKRTGCVLLAAEWSKQLFDTAQLRTLHYPLTEGEITDTTVRRIAAAIKDPIEKLAMAPSPMHEAVKGYPDKVDAASASTMKDTMIAMVALQSEIQAVRASPPSERMARAKELVGKYWKPPVTPSTVFALLRMIRISAKHPDDYKWLVEFIDKLPAEVMDQERVRELYTLALSFSGKDLEAVGQLEALIAFSGPTAERLSLWAASINGFSSNRERPHRPAFTLIRPSTSTNAAWSSTITYITLPVIFRALSRTEAQRR